MKKSTVRLLSRSARPVCIARTSTNAGHVLAVCVAAHGDILMLKATRDGKAVRALSVAFEGRKPYLIARLLQSRPVWSTTWRVTTVTLWRRSRTRL